jgi:serine/threonine protein kinase, bacterial
MADPAAAEHETVAWDDNGAGAAETTAVPPATVAAAALAWSAEEDSTVVMWPDERRRWPIVAAVVAAVSAVGIAATVGGYAFLHQDQRPPAAAPAPTPSTTAAPAPAAPKPLMFDGTYRQDYHFEESSFQNDKNNDWRLPDDRSPDWIAITSSCTPTGCFAVERRLDPDDHRHETIPPSAPIVLHLVNGTWSEVSPRTFPSECVHERSGSTATAINSIGISLTALPDGSFQGTLTQREESNECGGQGSAMITPVSLTRVGPVPAGITR